MKVLQSSVEVQIIQKAGVHMEWNVVSLNGSRPVNEDCVQVITCGNRRCFVVADGLGGHGKGEVASALAVKAFNEVFTGSAASLRELLSAAFKRAQAEILAEQKRSGNYYQMKTTVCALAVSEDEAVWGHIGDTRLYAFSHNRVKTRTLDHSVPQMLVLAREIKEKEIRNHPDRNKLLRVLGISGETPQFELSEPQNLHKYQAFLLCSDGFWELILEKEMCSFLKKSTSAAEWLRKMKDTVEERGAGEDMDNFSAIAVLV